jgi:hypothetical protein
MDKTTKKPRNRVKEYLKSLEKRNSLNKIEKYKKLLDVFSGKTQKVKRLTKEIAYYEPKSESELRIDMGPNGNLSQYLD